MDGFDSYSTANANLTKLLQASSPEDDHNNHNRFRRIRLKLANTTQLV